jgi:hypothetical protein
MMFSFEQERLEDAFEYDRRGRIEEIQRKNSEQVIVLTIRGREHPALHRLAWLLHLDSACRSAIAYSIPKPRKAKTTACGVAVTWLNSLSVHRKSTKK